MKHETNVPALICGAFDRHNFGDLLFAHVAAAMLPDRHLLFAGLAERDLRPYGGHNVKALARLASRWCSRPLHIVHAGGELLTCSAWEAAVMLLPAEQARSMIAHCNPDPGERARWAREQLGFPSSAPYCVPRTLFPQAACVAYHAVGGVDLDVVDRAMRVEVLEKLRDADHVSVRDRHTLSHLEAGGVAAGLIPDPAVMTATLFGGLINARILQGETAQLTRAIPQGYLAVQFSADFGDETTLDMMASQFDKTSAETGYGIALFRAGAAPWHDDLDCYRRIATRTGAPLKIFDSLDLWDICALIAGSRGYLGSSLHGRIVAMAYGLPRLNLRHPARDLRPSKQEAYAATWDAGTYPAVTDVHEIAESMRLALAADASHLRNIASNLVAEYRRGFDAMRAAIMR